MALAFAVAASANLPTILYSLFWKGFNTRGALWSIYGGLISSIGLIIFSPVVSGKPAVATKLADGTSAMLSPSMFTNPDIDFHWFPLDNPGLISIPLAFFLGWLGSKLPRSTTPRSTRRWRSAPSPVTVWDQRSTTDGPLHRGTRAGGIPLVCRPLGFPSPCATA